LAALVSDTLSLLEIAHLGIEACHASDLHDMIPHAFLLFPQSLGVLTVSATLLGDAATSSSSTASVQKSVKLSFL
jgi:hypothetical protein